MIFIMSQDRRHLSEITGKELYVNGNGEIAVVDSALNITVMGKYKNIDQAVRTMEWISDRINAAKGHLVLQMPEIAHMGVIR